MSIKTPNLEEFLHKLANELNILFLSYDSSDFNSIKSRVFLFPTENNLQMSLLEDIKKDIDFLPSNFSCFGKKIRIKLDIFRQIINVLKKKQYFYVDLLNSSEYFFKKQDYKDFFIFLIIKDLNFTNIDINHINDQYIIYSNDLNHIRTIQNVCGVYSFLNFSKELTNSMTISFLID